MKQTVLMRRTLATVALVTLLVSDAKATFPEGPLDCLIFDYSDEAFLGQNFSFATDLTYTMGSFPDSEDTITGLIGFSAPSDLITPVPGFNSGDEVPIGGQNLSNLFPTETPDTLGDLWADQSISADGDFQNGFSSFSVQQRKVADASQADGDFIDAFVEAKANVPFEVDSPGNEMVPANLDIHLDSFFTASGSGGLSEGVSIQILNVSDLENPTLEYEIEGFYFFFEGSFDASFFMGDTDLTENLTATPTGENLLDPVAVEFGFEMDVMLDPNATYAVNILGDASTFVDNGGSAGIDSSNTLDVTVSLLDSSARLVIPGTTIVPEPTTSCLLLVAVLSGCGLRRRQ